MSRSRRPPLGQVFLTDRRAQQRIIDALELRPEDAVLEIGAGPGNMTERLAAQSARVFAVEVDPRLVQGLRAKFAENPRVEIIEADILEFPIDSVAARAGRERLKVFGNLPYYITSPCLLHLFHHHRAIEEIVATVQWEVARRITASPGTADYGLLSVTCRYYAQPELLFRIPPKAFRPQPQVHSAVVRLRMAPQKEALGIPEEAQFLRFVKASFAQRRKTLWNNLKAEWGGEAVRQAMEQCGIPERARAEALSLEQFAGLHRTLREEKSATSPAGSGGGRHTS